MEGLPRSLHLTGVSGGRVTRSSVAAVVEGGMGNTYHGPQHNGNYITILVNAFFC